MKKTFRPNWIEPIVMDGYGYELVSESEEFLEYKNKQRANAAGYGELPAGRRIIRFNCQHNKYDRTPHNVVFVGIDEYKGNKVRRMFNGVCDSIETFEIILKSIR